MSFRLFIYYSAVSGGCAALVGFLLGTLVAPADALGRAGVLGLFVGFMVALALGFVDAVWNVSFKRLGLVLLRALAAGFVGALAGVLAGLLAHIVGRADNLLPVLVWTLAGSAIGASVGIYELGDGFVRQVDVHSSRRKLIKCLIGGALGGATGGTFAVGLGTLFTQALPSRPGVWLWSPWAIGYVALGMSIGACVGLVQVMLREAWIRVEAGVVPGRELLLLKDTTTLGRAESADIDLSGDPQTEEQHAAILFAAGHYYLEDFNTPAGTLLNNQRVAARVLLQSGDRIRLGGNVLLFGQRQRRMT